MIKTINVEPIKFREKYLSTPLLTKAEVEKAMDYVVAQTRANMEYFGTKFPWSATKGLKYPIIENIEWTDGFWTGLLWLCYVKLTPQRDRGFDRVAEKIYNYPEVKSVYLMSGAYDLSVLIEGKTMKEVALFVSQKLATIEAVISTATHFVLHKYKDKGVLYDNNEIDERGNFI